MTTKKKTQNKRRFRYRDYAAAAAPSAGVTEGAGWVDSTGWLHLGDGANVRMNCAPLA